MSTELTVVKHAGANALPINDYEYEATDPILQISMFEIELTYIMPEHGQKNVVFRLYYFIVHTLHQFLMKLKM